MPLQALLNTFDSWVSKSSRYGLRFWPLINVGDGGDTGLVRSESLVRFSAYSSLAYGAKGINWYCWGRGIYNLTTDSPTPIYDVVKNVNTKVLSWADDLLRYPVFEGVFHTGTNVSGPASSTWSPSPDTLVTDMSEDLLVGVMTRDDDADGVLLVVVDKRVDSSLNGGGTMRDVVVNVQNEMLKASLLPGDAELFVLKTGRQIATRMRRWRNDGTLASVHTTQYAFYNAYFKAYPQTAFPIGFELEQTADVERRVADAAFAGYNAVMLLDDESQEVASDALNAGLRYGVFAFTSVGVDAVHSALCHPALGGFVLDDDTDVDMLRHDASHTLTTVRAHTAVDVVRLASTIPSPCYDPAPSTSLRDLATELVAIRNNTFMSCSSSDLITTTSLAFGAKGVMMLKGLRNDDLARNVASEWGKKLLDASLLTVVSTGFANVPGVEDGLEMIVRMDSNLTLSMFEQGDATSSPPMFFVANQLNTSRTIHIEFDDARIAGWTPLVGCPLTGFATCSKMVLGNVVQLDLAAHGAEMFYVTMYASSKAAFGEGP